MLTTIQNIFLQLEQTEYLINILETVADEETKEKEDEAEEKVEENKPETEPVLEPKVEEGMLLLFFMRCWKFHNNCYVKNTTTVELIDSECLSITLLYIFYIPYQF